MIILRRTHTTAGLAEGQEGEDRRKMEEDQREEDRLLDLVVLGRLERRRV
jgi:hypothetical protein